MAYHIEADDQIIGNSMFESSDPSMGIARGVFVPAAAYDTVRSVFELYARALSNEASTSNREKLADYYQARDALHLILRDESGKVIPSAWIHIEDFTPLGYDVPLIVEAQISDPEFFHVR